MTIQNFLRVSYTETPVQKSQFQKSANKFEFWHYRPISCFDPAMQPIKTIIGGGQVFGTKLFLSRFDCKNYNNNYNNLRIGISTTTKHKKEVLEALVLHTTLRNVTFLDDPPSIESVL